LTFTGFIGSEEPGIVAIDGDWSTPDVSGAGSVLGGTAAVASLMAAAIFDAALVRAGGVGWSWTLCA
jgi:hypothetical protein